MQYAMLDDKKDVHMNKKYGKNAKKYSSSKCGAMKGMKMNINNGPRASNMQQSKMWRNKSYWNGEQ